MDVQSRPETQHPDRPHPEIRPATVADVPTMARIINDCAEYGQMLHRSLAQLYERIRDFHVAEAEDESGDQTVVGVCGLAVVWGDLAEVCALAVAPSHRGFGLGKRLVRACLEEAVTLKVRRVMTLTYERRFFEKLGFEVVDRMSLPLKVWSECLRCPKNQDCDEIAMIRILKEVPAEAIPDPQSPPMDQYVVPVVRRSRSASQALDEVGQGRRVSLPQRPG